MFERFFSRYEIAPGTVAAVWEPRELMAVEGYSEIARRVAGLPLGGGIFRIVSAEEGEAASSFVREGFPEFAARAVPFAVDWLGRVFAIDRARPLGSLLIEPGSAEAFEIDQPFALFLNLDLVEEPELLEAGLYDRWLAAGGSAPTARECVGFKVPLFLGGTGSVENLELTDLAVYWSLSAQFRLQTRHLAPGTHVDRVTDQ